MINLSWMAGAIAAIEVHGALSAMTAPSPIPEVALVAAAAHEPVVGKELHVMYHFIVPTEPFANVRMIASQTTGYAPGEGRTLEQRQEALTREARGLRNLMLAEAEVLRRDLTDKAFTIPKIRTSRRTPSHPVEVR